MAQKLRFLNEYGELDTVEPGDCVEAFWGKSVKGFG